MRSFVRKLSWEPRARRRAERSAATRTLIQLIQDRSAIQTHAGLEMKEKFAHYNLELEEVLVGGTEGMVPDGWHVVAGHDPRPHPHALARFLAMEQLPEPIRVMDVRFLRERDVYAECMETPCDPVTLGADAAETFLATLNAIEARVVAKHLARLGIRALPLADALAALGSVLDDGPTQAAVMDVEWSALCADLREGSGQARFSDLVAEVDGGSTADRASGPASALASYAALDDDAARARVLEAVLASVAHVTRVPVENLDPRARLRDLGMDSLMALEIAAELERALGVKVPAMAVTNGPPIDELAKLVLAQLVLAHAARPGCDVAVPDVARPLPPPPSLHVASRAA